jgi:hypothetical protein
VAGNNLVERFHGQDIPEVRGTILSMIAHMKSRLATSKPLVVHASLSERDRQSHGSRFGRQNGIA